MKKTRKIILGFCGRADPRTAQQGFQAMKRMGYWIESLKDTEHYPPQLFVGSWDDGLRERIAAYLDRGETFEQYRGQSWCRFQCESHKNNGSCEFSDGRYVWPQGLAHYVRDHHVILPEEFVAHVLSDVAPIPSKDWDRRPLDEGFWKDWCRERCPEEFRVRLEAAQRDAATEAARLLADKIARIETEKGVSTEKCRWRGCTNRALRNTVLCASCGMRGQEWMYTDRAYFNGLQALLNANP